MYIKMGLIILLQTNFKIVGYKFLYRINLERISYVDYWKFVSENSNNYNLQINPTCLKFMQ